MSECNISPDFSDEDIRALVEYFELLIEIDAKHTAVSQPVNSDASSAER